MQILHRLDRAKSRDEITIDSQRRARERREAYIEHLSRNHAARFDLPMAVARERVRAVAVSACKRDDEAVT
jgi:hypothetical protein